MFWFSIGSYRSALDRSIYHYSQLPHPSSLVEILKHQSLIQFVTGGNVIAPGIASVALHYTDKILFEIDLLDGWS